MVIIHMSTPMVAHNYLENSGTIEMQDLFWLTINNHILTWDNLLKRGFIGPRICSLCRMEEEYTSHLFITCSFNHEVWGNIISDSRLDGIWCGDSLISCVENWRHRNKANMELPIMVCWEIWNSRNRVCWPDFLT